MMFVQAADLHTYICQDIVLSLSPTRKAGFSRVGVVCAGEKIRRHCYIVNEQCSTECNNQAKQAMAFTC